MQLSRSILMSEDVSSPLAPGEVWKLQLYPNWSPNTLCLSVYLSGVVVSALEKGMVLVLSASSV